jgi:hypothetical protein
MDAVSGIRNFVANEYNRRLRLGDLEGRPVEKLPASQPESEPIREVASSKLNAQPIV